MYSFCSPVTAHSRHRLCMDAGQLNLQAPWFEAYKRGFLRTMAFADHETFDYPVACGLLALQHALRFCTLHVFCTVPATLLNLVVMFECGIVTSPHVAWHLNKAWHLKANSAA